MAEYQYYYGWDAEQFNFFRLPKKLIRDEQFKNVSSEAKILYGVLLDRMTLSVKNGWVDAENRVYIIYTVKEIMEEFNCGERKAYLLLNELDAQKGIGLIERKRQGLGKPNIIYVKNFNSFSVTDEATKVQGKEENSTYLIAEGEDEIQKNEIIEESGEVYPVQTCTDMQVKTCTGMHIKTCTDMHIKTCTNMHPNDTDNIETEYNNIYNNLSIHQSKNYLEAEDRWMDREFVQKVFRKRLEYTALIHDNPYDKQLIDELFALITDVCSNKSAQNLCGTSMPVQEIRRRFLELNKEHISYVLYCLKRNSGKIGNIKAYILTCLYNAPATMHTFYTLQVQHDQYG